MGQGNSPKSILKRTSEVDLEGQYNAHTHTQNYYILYMIFHKVYYITYLKKNPILLIYIQ